MRLRQIAFAALGMLSATLPCAQGYPERPLHLLVPYSVGTPPDLLGRIAAAQLQAGLGQPVVVDNRPGAAGTIGLAELARQPADGYTLLALAMPTSVAPALYPQAKLDLSRDTRAVGQMVFSYNVLVAHPAVPAASVAELIALLKAQPGKLSYGSGGNGTPAHLAGELFRSRAGVSAQHVPYNVLPQAVGDLVAGRLEFMFLASAPALAQVGAGKLRALAVTGPKRLAILGNVPTMDEAGFADFLVRDWQGLIVRAGTPPQIVQRLNAELNRGMAVLEVRAKLENMGAEPAPGTPRAFDELIAAEVKRWGALVQSAGIKPD
jgi:tripartite-type tricarboxylate transporter receptor subunit TctC